MIRHIDLTQRSARDPLAGIPGPPEKASKKWYAVEASAVPELVGVNPAQGLMESEVVTRRLRFGVNSAEGRGSRRVTLLLLVLFLSIVIGFLMTAAIFNSAITDNIEAFSILAITLLVAIVGFAYLLKSARALDRMAYATRTHACVKRDGHDIEINPEELVPGDIILVKAGDPVPADCRLLESAQLRVDESALTGKGAGIEKQIAAVPLDADIDQRRSMLFLGTNVLSGNALAAVVATGFQTELGKRAVGDF
jgi:P-type Ca2+ transporter type 2C